MSEQTVLVFDLMDTVVRDPFFERLPSHVGADLGPMLQHRDPAAWPAFERGELSEQAFFDGFYGEQAPKETLPEACLLKDVIVNHYRIIEGMGELLGHLKAEGKTLWVLSNYPEWFEIIRKTLNLDRFFEGYSISYLTGFRKPNAEAYEQVAQAVAQRGHHDVVREPGGLLLVDDRDENCRAARNQAWDAIHFSGTADLRAALRSRKLLPAP